MVSILVLLTHVLECGKTKEFKLLPTIKEIEQLHHTLDSLTLKDLLVMLLRTKLLKTQSTPSLMPRGLLEESLLIQLSKRILNYGHSKSNQDQKTSQSLLLNTKDKPRNSTQNKSHPWS